MVWLGRGVGKLRLDSKVGDIAICGLETRCDSSSHRTIGSGARNAAMSLAAQRRSMNLQSRRGTKLSLHLLDCLRCADKAYQLAIDSRTDEIVLVISMTTKDAGATLSKMTLGEFHHEFS
jgi:hypothetical protein